ncbi:MAG: TRAP transporter substrate-binding protein [Rhodocyclaceae bacterium]|nr:TRAP transporter substrate-binding protein [Rhodocyclaceae bacterium]
MNTVRKLVAAFACASLGLAAFSATAQTKWDMPTPYPVTNFHTENIQQFANDIDKASGGKLKITLHPGGSLFKANEIKRAVQGGQAQIGEIILSGYSNENPLFGTDNVPFLATSYAEAKKLYVAQKPGLDALLAKQGLKMLFSIPWPPQGIFTKNPINSAADLKGVKWRAYNPQTSRIAELVGAQPVTIQAAELSQALATGAVSAFMTSGATGSDAKVWEQVKYFYDAQAWLPKNAVLVSQKAFDALDKATQDAVLKAAAEADVRGWKISEEKTKFYLGELARNGMTVTPPSPALQADLKKIGDTMVAEFLKTTGADGQAVLDAYRK